MEFRKCTEAEMWQALKAANENYEYEGNLCWGYEGIERKRGALHTKLRTKKAGVIGSRLVGQKMRRSTCASWEAHRDFMRELFKINPNATIRTSMAFYRGSKGFEETFPDTAYKNIGSEWSPMTMPDATCVPEEPKPPIPRKARSPFNAMVRKVRKALTMRIEIGEFDHVEDIERGRMQDGRHLYPWLEQLAELVDKGLYIDFDLAAPLFTQPRMGERLHARGCFEASIKRAKLYWEENVYTPEVNT